MDESFLNIDQHNLDAEWLKQPALYFKWAKKAADARRAHEEAKSELDVVKAELSRAIREDPENYGLEKVTEGAVTAAIPEQKEYKVALKAVFDARHSADVYSAVVVALEHRKRALENIVDLFGMNYFSKPKAPTAEAAEKFDEASKREVRGRSRRVVRRGERDESDGDE